MRIAGTKRCQNAWNEFNVDLQHARTQVTSGLSARRVFARVIALEKRETCPRCSRFPVEKERDRPTPASTSRALAFRGNAKRQPVSSAPFDLRVEFKRVKTNDLLFVRYGRPIKSVLLETRTAGYFSRTLITNGFEAVGWRVAPLRVRRRASVNRVSMTLAADLSARRATTPTATIASPSFPTSFNRLFPVKVARLHQNVSLRANYDIRTSSKLVRYTKLRARNNQRQRIDRQLITNNQ